MAFRILLALAVLAVPVVLFAGTPPQFPPAGTDLIQHDLRIDMDIGDNGSVEETLLFKGSMRVDRGDPFVNAMGFRQVNFLVTHWVARAQSQVLGEEITYALSPGVDQIPSMITAQSLAADYPAYFKFNVIFDALVAGQTLFQEHHGMPEGGGFHTVPPTAGSPTITQFETPQILIVHPSQGPIRFQPVDCMDQNGVTLGSIAALGSWQVVALGTILLVILAVSYYRGVPNRMGHA